MGTLEQAEDVLAGYNVDPNQTFPLKFGLKQSGGGHQAVIIQVKDQPELTFKLHLVLDEESRNPVGGFRCPKEECNIHTRSFSQLANHHLEKHRLPGGDNVRHECCSQVFDIFEQFAKHVYEQHTQISNIKINFGKVEYLQNVKFFENFSRDMTFRDVVKNGILIGQNFGSYFVFFWNCHDFATWFLNFTGIPLGEIQPTLSDQITGTGKEDQAGSIQNIKGWLWYKQPQQLREYGLEPDHQGADQTATACARCPHLPPLSLQALERHLAVAHQTGDENTTPTKQETREGLFDILAKEPHNLDLKVSRTLTVYRFRSKPGIGSHESVVIQPWTTDLIPQPIEVFVRLHVVVDASVDETKLKVISEALPFNEHMAYVCECKLRLMQLSAVILESHHAMGLYGTIDASCVSFAENLLSVLSKSAVQPDLSKVPPEHKQRQRQKTSVMDKVKVIVANVGSIITTIDGFLDLVIFIVLLGGPFPSFGAFYFALGLACDIFQQVDFVSGTFPGIRDACQRFCVKNSKLGHQTFFYNVYDSGLLKVFVKTFNECARMAWIDVLKMYALWLYFQGQISISALLVIDNSIRAIVRVFGDALVSCMRSSGEGQAVFQFSGTLLQAFVCSAHNRFFKFLLSLLFLLPGPYFLLSSLLVLILVWCSREKLVMGSIISLGYFTGSIEPKAVFACYCVCVIGALILVPMAEIHIEVFMLKWFFVYVYCCYAFNCFELHFQFIKSFTTFWKQQATLLKIVPQGFKAIPFSVVRQHVIVFTVSSQQNKIPPQVWLSLLLHTKPLVKNLNWTCTLLFCATYLTPWILYVSGFSLLMSFVSFICIFYAYSVSIRMFFILRTQFDMSLSYIFEQAHRKIIQQTVGSKRKS